jgi:hypothetical protein
MAGLGTMHLERQHAAVAARLRQQRLRHDALEHERELRAHLRLLVGREHVEMRLMVCTALFVCSVAKADVARLGDGERRLDGLEVAHLADEHDVGVLPQMYLSAS